MFCDLLQLGVTNLGVALAIASQTVKPLLASILSRRGLSYLLILSNLSYSNIYQFAETKRTSWRQGAINGKNNYKKESKFHSSGANLEKTWVVISHHKERSPFPSRRLPYVRVPCLFHSVTFGECKRRLCANDGLHRFTLLG